MSNPDAYDELVRPCLLELSSFRAAAGQESIDDEGASRIHASLVREVDAMFQRGTRAAVPIADLEDIRYALVALVDEIASHSAPALRHRWSGQPLQLHYYRETTAGEGFFARLEKLLKAPRRVAVLKIYATCMLMGFRGRFAGKHQEQAFRALESKVLSKLPSQRFEAPERFRCPETRQSRSSDIRLRQGLLGIAGAALLLALGIFVGNISILKVRASGLSNELARLAEQ